MPSDELRLALLHRHQRGQQRDLLADGDGALDGAGALDDAVAVEDFDTAAAHSSSCVATTLAARNRGCCGPYKIAAVTTGSACACFA